jgi:hypothetical protein
MVKNIEKNPHYGSKSKKGFGWLEGVFVLFLEDIDGKKHWKNPHYL